MPLPKIDLPTERVLLPSNNKEVLIRPFLVKEEKILLRALTSDDKVDITDATKQIVNNCVVTPGFDVDQTTIYDLEYLLLKLRIVSVGEKLKLKFLPMESSSCDECKKQREVEVDMNEAKVVFPEGHEKKIALTDKIGIVLKDPEAKIMSEFSAAQSSTVLADMLKVIWKCVDYVYDEDTITSAKDVSLEEGVEFLEGLRSEQFKKIDKFFKTLPKLTLSVPIKCSKCEFQDSYVIDRLEDFFG